MNAQSMAQRAYSSVSTPIRTHRGTEYEAVARITKRLRAAAEKGDSGFPALAAALHDNKKLWSIFATDVADPGNGLPAELKARIFYLAEFTFKHTSEILGRRANAAPLIDINTAILRGLRGEVN